MPAAKRSFTGAFHPAPLYSGGVRKVGRTFQTFRTARAYKTINSSSTGRLTSLSAVNKDYTDLDNPVLLFQLNKGDENFERIGESARFDKLDYNFQITNKDLADLNAVKFMIVYDRMPRGGIPSQSVLMEASGPYGQTNALNGNRFDILTEKSFLLNSTEQSSNGVKSLKGTINMKGRLYQNNATSSGAIANINLGAIYLYVSCTGDGVTENNVTLLGSAVLYFRS